jgi:hypothetical protein
LRASIPLSATTPSTDTIRIHGCSRPNCAEFCADSASVNSAPRTTTQEIATSAGVR